MMESGKKRLENRRPEEAGQRKDELGIYIHIPFCVKKCAYCDFLSAPASEETKERYVRALVSEIESKPAGKKERLVTSIFFGGGTPSLLESSQTAQILHALRQEFIISPEAEITTEANPGTLDPEKLCAYRQMGFNRLSIGAQSFDDAQLRILGRIHTAADFRTCYAWARQAGFSNINIDLMAALPGQTREGFCAVLKEAVELAPEHLSVYSLIIEEGTPFYDRYERDVLLREQGKMPADLPDEEAERGMYADAEALLEAAGYTHYEISNYARPGFVCRHNDNCWLRREYLGFGIGAASLYEECRFTNHRDLNRYLQGDFIPESRERLSLREQMEETMFLGLRRTMGVSETDFTRKFGVDIREIYGRQLDQYAAEGLLEEKKGQIFLTERGRDLANYVMEGFLEA